MDEAEEQQRQAIRQTKQGLRQDEQGLRQDQGEVQQSITDKITTGHTEQLHDIEERQTVSDKHLIKIIDGVDSLSNEVSDLNKWVYARNYLDKIRNWLIFGFIIVFVIIGFVLGFLVHSNRVSDDKRTEEATRGRHQIADCTIKPGVVLDDGHVNPGVCYQDGAARTKALIDKLINDLKEEFRALLSKQN